MTPFDETGCKVNTTEMTDSNNGVSLMQSGDYDGGSFSGGDQSADGRWHRRAGQRGPHPELREHLRGAQNKPHNSLDGQPYSVPYGRGPNLLMYNTDVVTETPTS